DTITNITNGYYISNINPKIRTFKIEQNATVANIIDDSGQHKMEKVKPLTKEQFDSYIFQKKLLFLYIENGIIKSMDERYTP
ncbi:MAG: hypothetical protein ACPG4Z_08050, partial [Chitinophagales bacterium]